MTTRDDAASAQASPSDLNHYRQAGAARVSRILANADRVPTLADAALAGLAGDIVRATAPLTEATDAAMLGTLLTTFGAMVGRGAHVLVGPQQHFPCLFTVVVGGTSRDRKGTSFAAVRPVLEAADDPSAPFMTHRVLRGVQSGEALIQSAADSSTTTGAAANGVPDQRLLVLETEFARLATVAGRQNSILTEILRSVWDGDQLANRTRQQTLTADHAHIAILGHITKDELKAKLAGVDIANGFANRYIYLLSSRNNLHPEPGQLDLTHVGALGTQLRQAILHGQHTGALDRTTGFRDLWAEVYRTIESQPDGGGQFANLTARATAHLLRLSLVYALFDRSTRLNEQHLRSALALWEYSEATVAHIWGASLGDPRLDRLVAALESAGPHGLDRTQVAGLFGRNVARPIIDQLSEYVVNMGIATAHVQATGGRPRKVLVPTAAK